MCAMSDTLKKDSKHSTKGHSCKQCAQNKPIQRVRGICGFCMMLEFHLCSSCCCMESFSDRSLYSVMSYFLTSTAGDASTGSCITMKMWKMGNAAQA